MELTNLSFLNESFNNHKVVGAVACKSKGSQFNGSLLHDFEVLIIVVCRQDHEEEIIEHRMDISNTHIQVIYIDRELMENYAVAGQQRRIVEQFIKGEVIWDTDGEVERMRSQLKEMAGHLAERRIFREFSLFLTLYVEARYHMQNKQTMDAYNCIFQALQHWAKLELCEKGIYPESAVWEQVQKQKLDVYKLYEQLAFSMETMDQRVELVLLACEFSVMSKMQECSAVLFRVLRSRKQPWSIEELIQHPELSHVGNALSTVVRKLVYRSLIGETVTWTPQPGGEREIRYWIS
ncbi:nucleotidyltransferase-like protein [Paenibacillus wulumuqiensis]|uniref:nucleotidyltransferase-like protein n=1 Tax=Paenibacillus wulumuqiensis TaxID=1567107 RepID=UPI0006195013|nr:nucleotidyltransferase-like protein [Paenibacillus wulumuqiensis]